MCVICVSAAGKRLPTPSEIESMFNHNPHGAGLMYVRDRKVFIAKGFMDVSALLYAIRYLRLSEVEPVIFHFRLATAGGICPELTHPFPLSKDIRLLKTLDLACSVGIAHNGVIPCNLPGIYVQGISDTAMYIKRYMVNRIINRRDLENKTVMTMIERETNSKWAFLDSSGLIATIGNFIESDNLLFSNLRWKSA